MFQAWPVLGRSSIAAECSSDTDIRAWYRRPGLRAAFSRATEQVDGRRADSAALMPIDGSGVTTVVVICDNMKLTGAIRFLFAIRSRHCSGQAHHHHTFGIAAEAPVSALLLIPPCRQPSKARNNSHSEVHFVAICQFFMACLNASPPRSRAAGVRARLC